MTTDSCEVRIIHTERVDKAYKIALTPLQSEQLAYFFKALSDPNRVRILSALFSQEMCVCDIAAFLKSSESAVSHQLRLLRTTNLVKNRREGTVLYYSLADDHVKKIITTSLVHLKEKLESSGHD